MFETFPPFFVLKMTVLLTSAEVMARTGITARQLQWWDERGIVVPSRVGHRRLYSLDDLTEVAVICDLRRRGFSLQRVRKVIRLLQKEFKKRLVETVSARSEFHLLTDGQRIFVEDSASQVIDILKNSQQPMLALCLSDTVRQLQADLTETLAKNEAAPTAIKGTKHPPRRRPSAVNVSGQGKRSA
jgi:DNA-binding transcriptional MerR regulator